MRQEPLLKFIPREVPSAAIAQREVAASSELVVGFDQLMHHGDALDSLLRCADAPATARWGPLVAWMRHHPKMTPWCVLVSRNEEVVAAALLVRIRRGAVCRFETMGEMHLPSRLPARDPDSVTDLARALTLRLAGIRTPWTLHLHALEETDPVAAAIMERLDVASSELEFLSPRLAFTRGEPLTSYLSHNTRSAVAKARNRIKNAGLVCELGWTRDQAEIDDTVPEITELYRKRNVQRRQSVGLLDDADYRSYFADMMHAYAADGLVRLLTLRLNGELASYAMCLESAGLLFVYSNRMSPDWMHFSPGAITNAEVVRHACWDRSVRGVDWGSGIERYKVSGNATIHPYHVVHAWSSKTMCSVWTAKNRRYGSTPVDTSS